MSSCYGQQKDLSHLTRAVLPLVWGSTGLKSSTATCGLSSFQDSHFHSLFRTQTLHNLTQLLCFFPPLPFTTAPVTQVIAALSNCDTVHHKYSTPQPFQAHLQPLILFWEISTHLSH